MGKLFIAKLLHFNSTSSESTFIRLSLGNTAQSLGKGTFIHPDGVIINRKNIYSSMIDQVCETLVFQRLSDLEPYYQLELLKVLKKHDRDRHSNIGGNGLRIIATVPADAETKLKRMPIEASLRCFFKHHLQIPPLRDRREDTIPLAQMFLYNISDDSGQERKQISKQVKEFLELYE